MKTLERYLWLLWWGIGRPAMVRATAWKYPPWGLFALVTTGQVCFPVSYYEDGTVKIQVIDTMWFEVSHQVFGIHPGDLRRIGTL